MPKPQIILTAKEETAFFDYLQNNISLKTMSDIWGDSRQTATNRFPRIVQQYIASGKLVIKTSEAKASK